jgi:hypothetical protein
VDPGGVLGGAGAGAGVGVGAGAGAGVGVGALDGADPPVLEVELGEVGDAAVEARLPLLFDCAPQPRVTTAR